MLSDIVKQFSHGYNDMWKFLYSNVNSNKLKNDFYSWLRDATIIENLGQNLAWVIYGIYHPLKISPLIKNLDIPQLF